MNHDDNYEDMLDGWETLKIMARTCSDDELERNASVSIYSHHACSRCFNCACWAVKDERRNARTKSLKHNA